MKLKRRLSFGVRRHAGVEARRLRHTMLISLGFCLDFDGYDYLAKGKTLEQCLEDTEVIMGHAFVLAMLLTGNRLWEK